LTYVHRINFGAPILLGPAYFYKNQGCRGYGYPWVYPWIYPCVDIRF